MTGLVCGWTEFSGIPAYIPKRGADKISSLASGGQSRRKRLVTANKSLYTGYNVRGTGSPL